MKTLVRTKLLEGKYIEAKDYELFKEPLKMIHCISTDYKFCSHTSDPFMFLSLAEQKKGVVVNTQQSKFYPYSYYKIYKFLWKPFKGSADVAPGIDQGVKSKLADIFFTKYPHLRSKHE